MIIERIVLHCKKCCSAATYNNISFIHTCIILADAGAFHSCLFFFFLFVEQGKHFIHIFEDIMRTALFISIGSIPPYWTTCALLEHSILREEKKNMKFIFTIKFEGNKHFSTKKVVNFHEMICEMSTDFQSSFTT